MATALQSIRTLGRNLDHEEYPKTDGNPTTGERTSENPIAPTEENPKRGNLRRGGKNKGSEKKGITPMSPTVYLLPEEKVYFKRLKAHILLISGESISDHQLIMDAVREYAKKHYPDYK